MENNSRDQKRRVSLATEKILQGGVSGDTHNRAQGLGLDDFPEDILHQILSLVPLRDAARAACVSHKFLRSWRRFPNLIFNWKTFGSKADDGPSHIAKRLADGIHHVLKYHSGTGVKILKLQLHPYGDVITANHLDSWLQAVVKAGIIELALEYSTYHSLGFSFSCSLLSSIATSLQSFSLSYCSFHPTLTIGCLRSLKNVFLKCVNITEEELECFFSSTTALEKLEVCQCDDIALLKIPSHLQKLSVLRVLSCQNLQMIEINAPKVSTFLFKGPPIKISVSNPSQLKAIIMDGLSYSGMCQYALTKLHSIALNLQTLVLFSSREAFSMPASPGKFLRLRSLRIDYCGMTNFDFFSLVPFLEACPALRSFLLVTGPHYCVRQDSVMLKNFNVDSSHMRSIPEYHYFNLKKVMIVGFCSAKSLIELTCQILEVSSSLRCLVLDTTAGFDDIGICHHLTNEGIEEARRGVEAIEKYIKPKVRSSVNLEVLEPACSRRHIPKVCRRLW